MRSFSMRKNTSRERQGISKREMLLFPFRRAWAKRHDFISYFHTYKFPNFVWINIVGFPPTPDQKGVNGNSLLEHPPAPTK